MAVHIKKIFRIISSLLFIWLAVSAGLYFISGKIIYKTSLSHGQKFEVPYEQAFVKNAAGEKIDMMWAPFPSPLMGEGQGEGVSPSPLNPPPIEGGGEQGKNTGVVRTYIYLHGNAGRLPFIVKGLAKEGSVLAPAYPGFSGSEGRPDTKNINEVVDLSMEFLHAKGMEDKDIVVFGQSLGGSPAVYAAAKYPELGKVILVNTFYSVQKMCETQYYIFCLFSGGIHDTAAMAPLTKAPIRQFHVLNDNVIPFGQGEALFKLLGSRDKKFTMLTGSSHSYFDVGKVVKD